MVDPSICPSPWGTLCGISVGPGDPELLTLKGLRLLQEAAVVAFPAGVGGKPGIAEQIVAPWLQPHQVRLSLEFPYVQEEAVLQRAWEEAAHQVWPHLEQGTDVAFCSEGDVGFYSTFAYLAQTVQQQHPGAPVEIIPGVCSPLAAAAALGLPLTVRAQRLIVLPALYTVTDLETAIATADVVVLMKVRSVYQQVWEVLQRHHLLAHSAVIEWATWPQQRVIRDLGDRPSLDLAYFSLMVIQVMPN
ncbi:MAG: precorrin-2 C(20)-methyltransferase [Synechococcales bacterium]|nr:precorrin-2 C(20)-methyltransferase [Synechococcales bacterium]